VPKATKEHGNVIVEREKERERERERERQSVRSQTTPAFMPEDGFWNEKLRRDFHGHSTTTCRTSD
jgi:hypothetical protein